MPQKTYILCPGQGAQSIGMGRDFVQMFMAARSIFETANQILGIDLQSLCFDGPEDKLNQTNICQPAIYVAGVACFRAAQQAGKIDPAQVTAYAGLSLGEYTALHLAGVFTFEDGLQLVAARGRFMQEAALATPSGMVGLMGGNQTQIEQLCQQSAQGEILVLANFNAPGQIVVSGTLAACGRVAAAAEAAGIRAIPLKVAGAFHSPIMQSAAQRLGEMLERTPFSLPTVPVYANVTAQPHQDPASIKKLLISQLVQSVRWEQTMQTLASEAEAKFIELAPGRVLSGLLKKINRRLPIENWAAAQAFTPAESRG